MFALSLLLRHLHQRHCLSDLSQQPSAQHFDRVLRLPTGLLPEQRQPQLSILPLLLLHLFCIFYLHQLQLSRGQDYLRLHIAVCLCGGVL